MAEITTPDRKAAVRRLNRRAARKSDLERTDLSKDKDRRVYGGLRG